MRRYRLVLVLGGEGVQGSGPFVSEIKRVEWDRSSRVGWIEQSGKVWGSACRCALLIFAYLHVRKVNMFVGKVNKG